MGSDAREIGLDDTAAPSALEAANPAPPLAAGTDLGLADTGAIGTVDTAPSAGAFAATLASATSGSR